MAGSELNGETPAKLWVDSRNMLDIERLAGEIPVNWIKMAFLREIAGVIGVNFIII
ncbi:hypothetical protein [Paenibacillus silvestris]|uniref:hypothetical protein n=1 Tax=Paenibacillus silvestris TaxID=2606219 RepID=UPI001372D143|nr:hypothetical protein [Paenibacillus silvestris]